MLKALDLRVEYKKNPLGMDEKQPRFFYRLEGDSIAQTAYRIVVTCECGKEVWDSDFVEGSSTLQIVYEGAPLKRFTRYNWKVQVKDESGKVSAWSQEEAFFETGFLDTPWQAKWISAHAANQTCQPVRRLFCDFTPKGEIRKARYYATALGIYESSLNGAKVSPDCLTPGYLDFFHRTQYQAYDVTALLQKGANRLATLLGEGWYCGRIARNWAGGHVTFGACPMFLAELHIEYADGSSEVIATDDKTYHVMNGEQIGMNTIHMSDIYMGETFRSEETGDDWMKPGFHPVSPATWEGVPAVQNPGKIRIDWQSGASMRRMMEVKPVSIVQRKNGNWIVDFGQNLAGRERFTLKNVEPGTTIVIRHGEMLRADGSLYTANLRSAAATTTYFCDAAKKSEVYEPTFTFYGFRYIEISGWPGKLDPKQIVAEVIYSDLPMTGSFSCSEPLVNQLFSNIVWGQRGNFVDIPTDCPQRDERQGWTGDTQVFANVATYNMFSPEFYTKWIEDLNLGQGPEGDYGHFAPDPFRGTWSRGGCSGWSDAGIICPWTMFNKYADTRILVKYYDNMCKWLDVQVRRANGSYIVDNACYGDWLNIDAETPHDLISTAYLAGMTKLVAKIAFAIGRDLDGEYRETLAAAITEAYGRQFFTAKGDIKVKTQTAALLSLAFGITPKNAYKKTVDFLVKDIRDTHHTHLSTGFLGTPLLLKVLTETGNIDLAYDLLLQTTYPGWLYPVTQGATTMWERWNSYNHETGFGDVCMNSFNHYAYGAVGEWFYETICGIQPASCCGETAGLQFFRLAPQPGKKMTEAAAAYRSLNGEIKSAWKRSGKTLTWSFTIPCNTFAEIVYPTSGKVPEVKGIEANEDGALIAGPGSYQVKFTL